MFFGILVTNFEKLNKHIPKNIYCGFPIVKSLKYTELQVLRMSVGITSCCMISSQYSSRVSIYKTESQFPCILTYHGLISFFLSVSPLPCSSLTSSTCICINTHAQTHRDCLGEATHHSVVKINENQKSH